MLSLSLSLFTSYTLLLLYSQIEGGWYLHSNDNDAEIGREVVGGHVLHGQPLPITRDARGGPAGAEQDDDLELHPPGGAQRPGQRDGDDEDDEVGEDGEGDVGVEELRLVQALALDRLVPVGPDGAADEDLDDLDGQVGHEEAADEPVYALGHPLAHGEDAGDEEEEGDLCEVRRRAVDDGAGVEPLGKLSASSFPPFFFLSSSSFFFLPPPSICYSSSFLGIPNSLFGSRRSSRALSPTRGGLARSKDLHHSNRRQHFQLPPFLR